VSGLFPTSDWHHRVLRWIPLVALLALLTAACTSSSDPVATTAAAADTTTTQATGAATTSTTLVEDSGEETTTTVVTPETTEPAETTTTTLDPDVDPGVAQALKDEIDALVLVTEEVRGLRFVEPPSVSIITPEALANRIREDLNEDLEDIEVEERFYALLGLVDEGTDLSQVIEDLLAEQVLGFYDNETGEMVIAGDDAGLTALSKMTVIHELVHALTDQHFGFGDYRDQLVDEERYDEASALLALVEGDATYFQLVYMQEHLSITEQLAVANEVLGADTSALDASPRFLQADLEFPYDRGFFFVQELVEAGGIAAVDGAYEDLPTTTEHILHPRRYANFEDALPTELPEVAVAGYEELEESTMGEWGLRLLFIEDTEPDMLTQVGDGWGGDRYRILYDADDVAFVYAYEADRQQDAIEVAQAFLELAETGMGLGGGIESGGGVLFENGEGYAFVDRVDSALIFVAASDPTVGALIRDQVAPED
jgi:hypothetical protein